jgi:hypothetical protein
MFLMINFRIPKDETRRLEWLKSIAPPDFTPSRWSAVCSEHFTEESFKTNQTRKILKRSAVPKILNLDADVMQKKIGEASSTNLQQQVSVNLNYLEHDHSYPVPCQRVLKRKLDDSEKKVEVLQKKVKLFKQKTKKMQEKIESLNEVIDTLKQKSLINEYVGDILKEASSKVPAEIVKRLIKNSVSQKISREIYSPEMRCFAITLQFYSSKAYNFVRDTFGLSLPHENAVRRWYSSAEAEPGFTDSSFKTVKLKVEEEKQKDKDVFAYVMFDEMAIRKKIKFDGKKFVGSVDYGKFIYITFNKNGRSSWCSGDSKHA